MAARTPGGGPERDPEGPSHLFWFLGILLLLIVVAVFVFVPAWWPWSS